MGEIKTNKIEYVDVVSKPVGITYEKVQILGIYCWQYEKNEKICSDFFFRAFHSTQTLTTLKNFILVFLQTRI